MSRIHFYATANDIKMICLIVESKLSLNIYQRFEVYKEDFSGEIIEYQNFVDIPDLGKATNSILELNPSYTLIDKSIPLQPGKRQTMLHGEHKEKIYINATLNKAAVDFFPGGEFEDGSVLMGEMLNQISSKESERILRAFRTAMKKHFGAKARGSHWIGPEALERVKAGKVVTAFINHPKPELANIKLSEIEPHDAISSGSNE